MATRKPKLAPQVTTLWDYPSQHYGENQQGNQDYRGATPSYVIWNVVHRFTQPGELVLDPFCGSGTTLDVCADLDRRALGFDLVSSRPEIRQADARSLPLKSGSVDLVFMDPPYADNLDYSDDERCIGKLKGDGRYQRAMRLVLSEAARVLRPGKMLAIYVCDVFKKGPLFWPLGFELNQLAQEHFKTHDIIAVVRHNRTLEMGNYRRAADEGDFFLRGFNYLLLLTKREHPLTRGSEIVESSTRPVTDESSELLSRGQRPGGFRHRGRQANPQEEASVRGARPKHQVHPSDASHAEQREPRRRSPKPDGHASSATSPEKRRNAARRRTAKTHRGKS